MRMFRLGGMVTVVLVVRIGFSLLLREAPRISPSAFYQAPDIFYPAGGGTSKFLVDILAEIWREARSYRWIYRRQPADARSKRWI